jgi:hypothetical protein
MVTKTQRAKRQTDKDKIQSSLPKEDILGAGVHNMKNQSELIEYKR